MVSTNIYIFLHVEKWLWLYESFVHLLKFFESFWMYFEVTLPKFSPRSEARGFWIFLKPLARHLLAVMYSSKL